MCMSPHVRADIYIYLCVFIFPAARVNNHLITWLAYVEFQGTSRVEKLLYQGLGEHGGSEKHGAPALTVDWPHQAIRDQAEPLIDFTFGIQI